MDTLSNGINYSKLYPPKGTPEDEICVCSGRPPLKLMSALSYNPLHCINCNLEIKPETLALSNSLIDAIAHWRNLYDAIDRLWLDSGDYEQWALEELGNIHSSVNRLGLEVKGTLLKNQKAYYWYFQDDSREDFQPEDSCPLCHQRFLLYESGLFNQFICEACGIITVGTYDWASLKPEESQEKSQVNMDIHE